MMMEAGDGSSGGASKEVITLARARVERKHGKSAEQLWAERNNRVADAVNLKEPDRVPVFLEFRDFAISHGGIPAAAAFYEPDVFRTAFINMALDFEPDICNRPADSMMSGLGLAALGTQQMHWPGGSLPPDGALQFLDAANMKPEEYDLFLTDPTDFMLRYYLPRRLEALAQLSEALPPLGQTLAGNVPGLFWISPSLAGGQFQEMAHQVVLAGQEQAKFRDFGEMEELGFPSWVYSGGVCSNSTPGTAQPFDSIADLLRGMEGIVEDMYKRPEKLLLACDRVLEWRLARAVPADPNERGYPKRVDGGVTHWSFDSFLSKKQFETFCWPTWKKALLATIDLGFIPCPYLEGVSDSRVEYFLELPKGKVALRFERSDNFARIKAILRDHVCILGEVPASLMELGSAQEVEDYCRSLIEACGEGGGFILGAAAGLTRRAKAENVRAVVDSAMKYGRY